MRGSSEGCEGLLSRTSVFYDFEAFAPTVLCCLGCPLSLTRLSNSSWQLIPAEDIYTRRDGADVRTICGLSPSGGHADQTRRKACKLGVPFQTLLHVRRQHMHLLDSPHELDFGKMLESVGVAGAFSGASLSESGHGSNTVHFTGSGVNTIKLKSLMMNT